MYLVFAINREAAVSEEPGRAKLDEFYNLSSLQTKLLFVSAMNFSNAISCGLSYMLSKTNKFFIRDDNLLEEVMESGELVEHANGDVIIRQATGGDLTVDELNSFPLTNEVLDQIVKNNNLIE
jgi:hypothetical protein